VVSREQLLTLGVGRHFIGRHIERARLHPLHRGVYAVGHRKLTRAAMWMAAVLAAGDGTVLSHRSAAELWRIRDTSRRMVEVTAPRQRRPRPGLTVHRAARVCPMKCVWSW
jgi:predicted transcriptional regulator of viral defense system